MTANIYDYYDIYDIYYLLFQIAFNYKSIDSLNLQMT